MSSNHISIPDCPYRGLIPYSEEDAPFFFGRKDCTKIIIDNLMASRLTILYGTSGVGKSSILQAGVAYQLRQQARENLKQFGTPQLAVIIFNSWSEEDLLGKLRQQVKQDINRVWENRRIQLITTSDNLGENLQAWTEYLGSQEEGGEGGKKINGELFIILDQFEEYFLYHSQEDRFASQFSQAVNNWNINVNFLISIRANALDKLLDCFEDSITSLFDNFLRLEYLKGKSAEEAIIKPVEEYNDRHRDSIEVEPALVNAVLRQVKVGEVIVGGRGRGTRVRETDKLEEMAIDTPYLQLVMERLWNEEKQRWQQEKTTVSRSLKLETLNELGGAASIIKQHFEKGLEKLKLREEDKNILASVFGYLVTPSGYKIAYFEDELSQRAGCDRDRLAQLLPQLALPNIRILRVVQSLTGKNKYEIFHDRLAPAILEWQRQQREQEEFKKKLRKYGSVGLLVVFIILGFTIKLRTIGTILAESLGSKSSDIILKNFDNSKELASLLNIRQLKQDFQDSGIFGINKIVQENTPIPIVWRYILNNIKEKNLLKIPNYGNPAVQVKLSPQGDVFAVSYEDGSLELWDLKGNKEPLTAQQGDRKGDRRRSVRLTMNFSSDGNFLATVSRERQQDYRDHRIWKTTITLWNLPEKKAQQQFNFPTQESEKLASTSISYNPQTKILSLATLSREGAENKSYLVVRRWNLSVDRKPIVVNSDSIPIEENIEFGDVKVIFSPQGNFIALTSPNKGFRVWSLMEEQPKEYVVRNRETKTSSYNISFSPEEDFLATASSNSNISLWNLKEQQSEPLKSFQVTNKVQSLHFNSKVDLLAIVFSDGNIRVYDIVNNKNFELNHNFGEFRVAGDNFEDLSFRSERELVTVSKNNLFIVQFWEQQDKIKDFQLSDRQLVTFNLDDPVQNLAIASRSDISNLGNVYLWNLEQKKGSKFELERVIRSFTFITPSQLIGGSDDGNLYLWNPNEENNQKPKIKKVSERNLFSLSVSPSKDYLAIASGDGHVYVLKLLELSKLFEDEPYFSKSLIKIPIGDPSNNAVWQVSFNPDKKLELLAALLEDGNIYYIRNFKDQNRKSGSLEKLEKSDPDTQILNISFNSTGEFLAAGSNSGKIYIWKNFTTKLHKVVKTSLEDIPVERLSFNPNPKKEKQLAIALANGQIILGDLSLDNPNVELKSTLTLKTDNIPVIDLKFSPRGDYLAAALGDGTVRFWEIGNPDGDRLELESLSNETCHWLNSRYFKDPNRSKDSLKDPLKQLKQECEKYHQ